jgi:hypothetical protein
LLRTKSGVEEQAVMYRYGHVNPFFYGNSGSRPNSLYEFYVTRPSYYYPTEKAQVLAANPDSATFTPAPLLEGQGGEAETPVDVKSDIISEDIDKNKEEEIEAAIKKSRKIASAGPLQVSETNLAGSGKKRKSAKCGQPSKSKKSKKCSKFENFFDFN